MSLCSKSKKSTAKFDLTLGQPKHQQNNLTLLAYNVGVANMLANNCLFAHVADTKQHNPLSKDLMPATPAVHKFKLKLIITSVY